MASSDVGAQPRDSFSDRLQRYWDHPDPYGLVAMLKRALNGMADAVDYSVAATGTPPSTEEEAFRYNQLRDRGPIGALHAVSLLNPAAPQGTGGIFARAIADAARTVPPLAATASARAGGLVGRLRQGLEPTIEQQGKPMLPPRQVPITAPSENLPSNVAPKWDPARPYAVQPWAPSQPQPVIGSGGVSSAAQKDPNFRQLLRVPVDVPPQGGIVPSDEPNDQPEAEILAKPGKLAPAPDAPGWLPRKKKPNRAPRTSYGNGGGGRKGGNGSGGGGGDGGDENDECTQRRTKEEAKCWARKDDYAHPDLLYGCLGRAMDRWGLCFKNGRQPHPEEPGEWGPGDEEIWRNYDR